MKYIFQTTVLAWLCMTVTTKAQFVLVPCNNEPMDFGTTTGDWATDPLILPAGNYSIVVARDGTVADSLACNTIINSPEVNGKVALVYRGNCNYSLKALMAQNAGAAAVIIVNNAAGPAPDMGPGDFGDQVTIPVISVSIDDGALLRQLMASGTCELFIGDLLYSEIANIGLLRSDVSSARSMALPRLFTHAPGFQVPVSAFARSYYSNLMQFTNVRVRATIRRDGQLLFDQISPPDVNVSWFSSTLFTLPYWNAGALPAGLYEMEYTVSADQDAYPHDNVIRKEFWVNDSIFSHSAFDPVTGQAIVSNGTRPQNAVDFKWCQVLQSANASAYEAKAISFATLSSLNTTLVGQTIEVSLSSWNDPITSGSITFDDVQVLQQQSYTYTSDLQSQVVRVPFPTTVTLLDNQKYLACVDVSSPDVYVSTDGLSDYTTNQTAYPDEAFFPVSQGGQWYAMGFGTDLVPVIAVHLQEPLAVSMPDDQQATDCVKVFPNPADLVIQILSQQPIAMLTMTDALGRAMAVSYDAANGSVDVSNLPAGIYQVNVEFAGGRQQIQRIVIQR